MSKKINRCIRKRKLNKFCKYYKEKINSNINENEVVDFDELFQIFKDHFKSLEKEKLSNLKKDLRIRMDSIFNLDFFNYNAMFITLILGFITIIVTIVTKDQINDKLINLVMYSSYSILIVIIISLILRIVDEFTFKNKRCFYSLCLDIIEDIEKEREVEREVKFQKELFDKLNQLTTKTEYKNESFIKKLFKGL